MQLSNVKSLMQKVETVSFYRELEAARSDGTGISSHNDRI
jgi:hypothetical protein